LKSVPIQLAVRFSRNSSRLVLRHSLTPLPRSEGSQLHCLRLHPAKLKKINSSLPVTIYPLPLPAWASPWSYFPLSPSILKILQRVLQRIWIDQIGCGAPRCSTTQYPIVFIRFVFRPSILQAWRRGYRSRWSGDWRGTEIIHRCFDVRMRVQRPDDLLVESHDCRWTAQGGWVAKIRSWLLERSPRLQHPLQAVRVS